MPHKALKLTWKLATPIVVGAFPLHLDALVAFAMAEEGKRKDLAAWDDKAELDLPLGRESRSGGRCWKASAVLPRQPGEHAMRFWTRKSDPYDYAERLERGELELRTKFPLKPYGLKFDQVRGTFKQMFKFYPVRSVSELQAWCIGDQDRLTELLAPEAGYVTYLGSKSRMGHGRIVAFDITAASPSEEQSWRLRVLPWQEPDTLPLHATVEPPYWDATKQQLAWINPAILG